jgi:hypothetical protein
MECAFGQAVPGELGSVTFRLNKTSVRVARRRIHEPSIHSHLSNRDFPRDASKDGRVSTLPAWLQLIPKFRAHVDQIYAEQGIFSLQASTLLSSGAFDLLESSKRDLSLYTVRLYIEEEFNDCRGVEFMITFNDCSFYLKRDDLRWNEISL